MIPPLATNLSAFLLTLALVSRGAAADQPGPAPLNAAGIHGGLCIQIGGDETLAAQALAPTGRFLVALLAADDAAAAALRQCLQAQESYGLVSVDVLPPDGRLPYTENLANLVIVAPPGDLAHRSPKSPAALCPGSALLAPAGRFTSDELRATGFSAAPAGGWLVARKAWPREMDEWSHPRHAADGNPVSDDALAGPPRRIRWVAGPEREISSMVTAAGRNFYGGVWARDSFNGLRLWQRELTPSPAQGGFSFNRTRGSLPPIAAGPRLIAWADDQLAALDGATGAVVIRYPEAGRPSEVFVADDTLLAIDAESVRAPGVSTPAVSAGRIRRPSRARWSPATAPSFCSKARHARVSPPPSRRSSWPAARSAGARPSSPGLRRSAASCATRASWCSRSPRWPTRRRATPSTWSRPPTASRSGAASSCPA